MTPSNTFYKSYRTKPSSISGANLFFDYSSVSWSFQPIGTSIIERGRFLKRAYVQLHLFSLSWTLYQNHRLEIYSPISSSYHWASFESRNTSNYSDQFWTQTFYPLGIVGISQCMHKWPTFLYHILSISFHVAANFFSQKQWGPYFASEMLQCLLLRLHTQAQMAEWNLVEKGLDKFPLLPSYYWKLFQLPLANRELPSWWYQSRELSTERILWQFFCSKCISQGILSIQWHSWGLVNQEWPRSFPCGLSPPLVQSNDQDTST